MESDNSINGQIQLRLSKLQAWLHVSGWSDVNQLKSLDATCRKQNISCLLKSIRNRWQVSCRLLYTWSLPRWIGKCLSFLLNMSHHNSCQLQFFPSDKMIRRPIVAVFSQRLHFPRNPWVCLCPQLPAGTPLHPHPMESGGGCK